MDNQESKCKMQLCGKDWEYFKPFKKSDIAEL
jgi:hypothetical protein